MQTSIQIAEKTAASGITLEQLINLCIEKEASDIHFREDGRVALRVGGKIIFIENTGRLNREEINNILLCVLPDESERKRLMNLREIDFAYTHSNGISFRVNMFYQKGKLACVMRMIPKRIPALGELGVPGILTRFLNMREGLILVCGAAGSGKSTTIQSILSYINENFIKHILTIEDPIEYIFEDKKSMFTQREVGKDTISVANALKSAVREDTNVVMAAEISDLETFDSALKLVETGHLVISSMFTRDVTQTVERMVSFYPNDLRRNAQNRIADNLTVVLAQDLTEKQDGTGLTAVFELMFMNQSIRNIIKSGAFVQLRTAIQSASSEGMVTMDTFAYKLAEEGIIGQEQLAQFISEE